MRAELVRYDAKSSQFLPYLGGMSVMNLDFSRDGKWISYVKLPDGELWRSRIDGSEKLQLTTAPLFVEAAQWSPDGNQLVFTGTQSGGREHIYLVSAGSGAMRQIGPPDLNYYAAGWTPDDNSILVFRGHPAGEILASLPRFENKPDVIRAGFARTGPVTVVPGRALHRCQQCRRSTNLPF